MLGVVKLWCPMLGVLGQDRVGSNEAAISDVGSVRARQCWSSEAVVSNNLLGVLGKGNGMSGD